MPLNTKIKIKNNNYSVQHSNHADKPSVSSEQKQTWKYNV